MSSLIPSLKYSCSMSPLMFWNGRTQIVSLRRAARGAALSVVGGASAAMLSRSLRHPGAAASPVQR